jgi:hypothetical protein
VQNFKKYKKYVSGDIGRFLGAVFEVMLKIGNERNSKTNFCAENRKEWENFT